MQCIFGILIYLTVIENTLCLYRMITFASIRIIPIQYKVCIVYRAYHFPCVHTVIHKHCVLTSSSRCDRREELIYNKRFRLGLWVAKWKSPYLESCHITKLASFHSGHQQHSETLSLISPRPLCPQTRSRSHEAAHYTQVHAYSVCSTLLWIQDTTLSQQISASLCFISYEVHFHVQGRTDIFVIAL